MLTHLDKKYDPNSPVWNVKADKAVIANHSDIMQPVFVSFIQQLYHELIKKSSSENPGLAATATTGTASPRPRIEQMQPESK